MFAYFFGQPPTENGLTSTEDQADANTNDIDMPDLRDGHQKTKQQQMQAVSVGPDVGRKSHVRYILRIYVTSLLLLVCVSAQWALVSFTFKPFHTFAIKHDYLGLFWIVLALLLLLATIVAFDKLKRSVMLLIVCTFVMAEIGGINIVAPMLDAHLMEHVYAALGTGVVILFSFFMSFRGKTCPIPYIEINPDFKSLATWTAKIFMVSSLFMVVGSAMREPFVHLIFALILSILLAFYILMFGITIGSQKFFKAEVSKAPILAILMYLNFIELFANLLMFVQSIRHIEATRRAEAVIEPL